MASMGRGGLGLGGGHLGFGLGLDFLDHGGVFDLVLLEMVTHVFDVVVGGEVTGSLAGTTEEVGVGTPIQEPDTDGLAVGAGGLMEGGFFTEGFDIDIDPGLEEGLEDPDLPPPGGVVDGRPPVPGVGPAGGALRVLEEAEGQGHVPEIAGIEEFEAELVPGGEFGREGHGVGTGLYPIRYPILYPIRYPILYRTME
jgi:hypothetical protein